MKGRNPIFEEPPRPVCERHAAWIHFYLKRFLKFVLERESVVGEGQRETPAEREVPDPRAESRQPKPSARPSRSLDHVGLHSLKQVGVWGRARSGRGGDPRDPQTPPPPPRPGTGTSGDSSLEHVQSVPSKDRVSKCTSCALRRGRETPVRPPRPTDAHPASGRAPLDTPWGRDEVSV